MEPLVELIGILRQSCSGGLQNDDSVLLNMIHDDIVDKMWFQQPSSNVRMKVITKILVYAKMFQSNDLQEDISKQVFEFVQGLLEKMGIDQTRMTHEQEMLLCHFIWSLFGCTMFTYLFRLVDMQHDRN